MQYLEGQTLKQRMVRDPPGIGEFLDLGVQIVSALAAAHAKVIIHCDIKPSNVLITAATGKLPFQGPSALSIMHEIAVKNPTPPCTVSPHLPRRLDNIIDRALAKDRDQRYSSGSEIVEELKALSNLGQPED